MQKSWYWVLLLLLIVLVGSFIYWFSNPILKINILQKVAPNLVTKGSIPDELLDNFNPTINQSTFELVRNLDGESLEQKQVFPTI